MLTTHTFRCLQVLMCNILGIRVAPPHNEPKDHSGKRFDSHVKPQTEPLPLNIVLVKCPDVVDTCSVEDSSTDSTSSPGTNTSRVYNVVVVQYQLPTPMMRKGGKK